MIEVAQGRLCNLRGLLGLGMLIAMNLYACGGVRPNVLIILTDDQGWGDLGIHGNTNLSTPHLDSIAKQGASFLNYYVCQVCAPTRAEFLTGRYYPRTGVSGVSQGQERLNADETTLGNVFKAAGYATGAFGKWHNGTQSPLHPNDRGFDEYYGFTSGHWGHYFSPPLDHNGELVRGDGFIVDDLTNHAIEFIEANREQPFLCYVPLNTPHAPMMITDTFYERFSASLPSMRHRDPEREDLQMTRAALAMVENIDWNVGRLLKTLDRLSLANNTIVVYFSDNGPNSFRWNGGMKGKKGSIDEGGLRSPLFVRWPGKVKAGSEIEQIAAAIDLLPTLMDMADVNQLLPKAIDGISLMPLLNDPNANWVSRELFSIRRGQVSVRNQRFRFDAEGRLFDIGSDRGQRFDVSKKHPEVALKMKELAGKYRDKMEAEFERNRDRPFDVGFRESTMLPARDGQEHGDVERSVKSPNNSFFTNWRSKDASITWYVDVACDADYEVLVRYTCAAGDEGVTVRLTAELHGESTRFTEASVVTVFDPPLYDKSKERVQKSHYFVKDFKSLSLGSVHLPEGECILRLSVDEIIGTKAIDVHSIQLVRKSIK
ncbi:MAG: arylsulfatase [Rubripirellula sp.]